MKYAGSRKEQWSPTPFLGNRSLIFRSSITPTRDIFQEFLDLLNFRV